MSDCYAVLLDTVSIQNYIFSSNKLRENLGASYLVEEVCRTYLACALWAITGRTFDEELKNLDSWKEAESEMPDCAKPIDIGYIGGGNALLFFQDEKRAQKFIEEWTKILLVRAPGLTTAVACSPFLKDPGKFPESFKTLFKILERNKAMHSPITSLPRHGITAECSRSGASAEIYSKPIQAYVSAGTNARIEAASLSKEKLEETYRNELGERFYFPDELEDLGSVRGEDSHIAIVHIDGNEIGKRFKGASTLRAIRQLSKTVDAATLKAFDAVVTMAVKRYKDIMESLGFDADEKNALPIRPIVLGGDDVTFVCDGKLGIYFAKIFIEAFEQEKASDGKKLTACAGVSIIKTKYPFYRGYRLAEELCDSAKRARREELNKNQSNDCSFLDFHVSLGGIDGPLDEIRAKHFRNKPQGNLLYRPFKIVPKEHFDDYSLELFLENARRLGDTEERLPGNKLNELREVLVLPEEATRRFVQELKYRGRRLPEIKGHQYAETLFENNLTPYFDMIEILSFYPEFALRENGDKV